MSEVPTHVESLRKASQCLMAVFPRDEGRGFAIGLENLVAAFGSGHIRTAHIKGLRQFLRKSINQAWTDMVCVPLARSKGASDRFALISLPEELPSSGHDALHDYIKGALCELPYLGEETRAHLQRSLPFVQAVPVILGALERLDELDRVKELSDPSMQARRRTDTACKRLRLAFAREVAPLVAAAASVAHRSALGAVGMDGFRKTSAVLDRTPKGGVRQRDRVGMRWMEDLNAALVSDIVVEVAMPALTELFATHDDMTLEKACVTNEGLKASFVAHYGLDGTRIALTAHFDLASGATAREALVTSPGEGGVGMAWDDVGGFLAARDVSHVRAAAA